MLNARMALARSLREGISAPKNRVAGKPGMFAQSQRSGKPGPAQRKVVPKQNQALALRHAT
jgi:hypothetical protein